MRLVDFSDLSVVDAITIRNARARAHRSTLENDRPANRARAYERACVNAAARLEFLIEPPAKYARLRYVGLHTFCEMRGRVSRANAKTVGDRRRCPQIPLMYKDAALRE